MTKPTEETPWKIALRKGKLAAWQNRYAGICLWLFGCLLIVGYYQVDFVRENLDALGEWKIRVGWLFGILSTALFGGFLPVVFPLLFGQSMPRQFNTLLISNVIFWGYKGFEIDLLYRAQAKIFGDGTDLETIMCKVVADVLVYAPLVGLLNCVLFYIWRDNGFSLTATRTSLGKNWYVRKVMPALITNWCIWVPAVIFIYSLPLALQLPVQNLILCFWVLILTFFTSEEGSEEKI